MVDFNHKYWGKRVTLDNNKIYQTIWITDYQGKKYICLLNPEDYSDILFRELRGDEPLRALDSMEEMQNVIHEMNGEINRFVR